MALPEHYHRDWQRQRMRNDPTWYAERKKHRTNKRRQHKEYWVQQFGNQCLDCKQTYHPTVFEFHHPDPETKETRTRATNEVLMLSKTKAKKELDKCVMLCANCHRIRHALLDGWAYGS